MLSARSILALAIAAATLAFDRSARAQLDSLPPPPPPPYHAPVPPPPPPPNSPEEPPPARSTKPHAPRVTHREVEDIEAPSYEPTERSLDANADRVLLFPTGETQPKGTLFLSDYDLAILEGGYAITDDLQFQITGLIPVAHEPKFFDAGFKLGLYRSRALRFAISAGAVLADDKFDRSFDGGRGGAAMQICFEVSCRSSVSFDAGTFVSNRLRSYFPVYASAGGIIALSSMVQLLVEPAYGFASEHGLDAPKGFLLSYGVRVTDRIWGIDLAFVRPTGSGSPDPILPIGSPFVALTLRTPH